MYIRIYNNHTFVAEGIYKKIRHPLYASLIWMFFAGGLICCNWAAPCANALIFIPFMIFRAKQEETLLIRHFTGYSSYRKSTGMFFPKFGRHPHP
ncbi:MAG: isoprenylcysteine carboxylmethyltransferase family protein [bacterium]|nr:isoprenylcysteine carboxylmethyltransferase family protein [bacterium]